VFVCWWLLMLFVEALQIAKERRNMKSKGERE